jgi:hypothetical protein
MMAKVMYSSFVMVLLWQLASASLVLPFGLPPLRTVVTMVLVANALERSLDGSKIMNWWI